MMILFVTISITLRHLITRNSSDNATQNDIWLGEFSEPIEGYASVILAERGLVDSFSSLLASTSTLKTLDRVNSQHTIKHKLFFFANLSIYHYSLS